MYPKIICFGIPPFQEIPQKNGAWDIRKFLPDPPGLRLLGGDGGISANESGEDATQGLLSIGESSNGYSYE